MVIDYSVLGVLCIRSSESETSYSESETSSSDTESDSGSDVSEQPVKRKVVHKSTRGQGLVPFLDVLSSFLISWYIISICFNICVTCLLLSYQIRNINLRSYPFCVPTSLHTLQSSPTSVVQVHIYILIFLYFYTWIALIYYYICLSLPHRESFCEANNSYTS